MVREGTCFNHDPNAEQPKHFRHVVNEPGYCECWAEGLEVFHNPNALYTLPEEVLPGAAHIYLQKDGQVIARIPDWHPLGSITLLSVAS